MHLKARTERPASYPERFYVPDDKVEWEIDYPAYTPLYFVDSVVLNNDETKERSKTNDGWADSENFQLVKSKKSFDSYEGKVLFDKQGFPINPKGRTGITGRGKLGKWGANFAADPIITRLNPHTTQMELLAIKRVDNQQWAIPGGMVDKGETLPAALRREFREETSIDLDMSNAIEVYRGYVDDPRNTDNAWVETIARHKHLQFEVSEKMQPKAGDDAQEVKWLALTENNLSNLYANHKEFVKKAIAELKSIT